MRRISKQFGFDYFDGDRSYGYGGFTYDPRYWSGVVEDIICEYGLSDSSSVLDVGCAKGFMLADFKKALPGAKLAGVDISEYAIREAHPDVRALVQPASALALPFSDGEFELVISINTIHNLPREEVVSALREISRVAKNAAFVVVDGFETDKERQDLEQWVLTAETVLSVEDWEGIFQSAEYEGDYDFWKVV